MLPPVTVVGLTTIAAHAVVVNDTIASAVIASGGSSVSSSAISLLTMRSVQDVFRGSGLVG